MEYLGYRYLTLTDEMLADFYSGKDNLERFIKELENNSYILFKHQNKIVDEYRIVNGKYRKLEWVPIENNYIGKITPRNPQQKLAFDLLQNKDITIKFLTGVYGGGKTFLMVNMALEYIRKGTFKSLIWVRNNIEVKNSNPLGALPGTAYDKLLPFCMPIADHVGGIEALENLISQGTIEVQHLGFMRGRDIHDSIILCSESENMTKEHVQLLIGRVGEGSQLWMEGDLRQTDKEIFENNSGLGIGIHRLSGNDLFGYVHFPKTERSKTAQLADLLD